MSMYILKENRIEEELAKAPWKVGDILYTSWGYDQTNVSFYQVTRMVGKTMIELRKISTSIVENSGNFTGLKAPNSGSYVGEPLRKKIPSHPNHGVKISHYEYAYRWNGKPVSFSSYA